MRRLLREPSPALNRLPGRWLAGLLARVREAGQSRDDIVRRSAGLPYAFVALFLAEPPGPNKVCCLVQTGTWQKSSVGCSCCTAPCFLSCIVFLAFLLYSDFYRAGQSFLML